MNIVNGSSTIGLRGHPTGRRVKLGDLALGDERPADLGWGRSSNDSGLYLVNRGSVGGASPACSCQGSELVSFLGGSASG